MPSATVSRHLLALVLCAQLPLLSVAGVHAQAIDEQMPGGVPGAVPGGEPGVSSEGSPGMEEQGAPAFIADVNRAARKGKRSLEYIGSLVQLAMYYNRHDRFADARRNFLQALTIIDSGALKPSPKRPQLPPLVEEHGDGTVSATNLNPPTPYEDIMSDLLAGLASAEIELRQFGPAELHVKRMIALADADPVRGAMNKMSAYSTYAVLLRKTGRLKEAQAYQKKADDINASFKPL